MAKVRRTKTSMNMTDMMKCFCALLVHGTSDGKVRISKKVLDMMPDNFGTIMEVQDLGDSIFIRIKNMPKQEIPKHGIIIPSGSAGPRDVRPVININ